MKAVYVSSLIDSHGGGLRIVRYLKVHPDCGLFCGVHSHLCVKAFTDADSRFGRQVLLHKQTRRAYGRNWRNGEEFVEFLEKEMNITDAEVEAEKDKDEGNAFRKYETEKNGSASKTEAAKQSSIEDDIDEIEATLAQLKRDLGL